MNEMRRRRVRPGMLAAAVFIAAVVATGAYLIFIRAAAPAATDGRAMELYGLVVDQDGRPLAGVTVVAVASDDPVQRPGERAVAGPETEIRVVSDAGGRFAIRAPGADSLGIMELNRDGYTWLFDHAWWAMTGEVPCPDNMNFGLAYIPDRDRPAVFPMIRRGTVPATLPSRGGSDRLPDGRVIRNEPVPVLVPSTGPTAPRAGTVEVELRVREVMAARRGAATRAGATRPSDE